MKKLVSIIILSLCLTGLTACTSATTQVQNSVNAYYYYTTRFEEVCPTYDSKDCPQYKPAATLLQKWEKQLKDAKDAVNRGGKLPLQLKALKDTEHKVRDTKL